MKKRLPSALFIGIVLFSLNSFAQCKGFTKQNCLSNLAPYLSNGQLISSELSSGEKTEVHLNFNKGLAYRILLCSNEDIPNLSYTLIEAEGNVLSSKELNSNSGSIDLQVQKTATFTLQIEVPESKNAAKTKSVGCVSVLIGFKEID